MFLFIFFSIRLQLAGKCVLYLSQIHYRYDNSCAIITFARVTMYEGKKQTSNFDPFKRGLLDFIYYLLIKIDAFILKRLQSFPLSMAMTFYEKTSTFFPVILYTLSTVILQQRHDSSIDAQLTQEAFNSQFLPSIGQRPIIQFRTYFKNSLIIISFFKMHLQVK